MNSTKQEYQKQYYLNNKQQLLAKHRERNKASPRYALTSILALARKRAEVSIDQTHLLELYDQQEGLCALSGVRMTWATGSASPTSISVDRIDPTKGYVEGNVRLVCMAVNAFRSTMDDAGLLKFAKALVANMEASAKVNKLLEEVV